MEPDFILPYSQGYAASPSSGIDRIHTLFSGQFFRDRAISVVHPYLCPLDTTGYFIGIKMAEA
jgi:hypothetical protein